MMSRIGSPVPLWSHQIRASGRLTNGISFPFHVDVRRPWPVSVGTSAAGCRPTVGGIQGPGVVPAVQPGAGKSTARVPRWGADAGSGPALDAARWVVTQIKATPGVGSSALSRAACQRTAARAAREVPATALTGAANTGPPVGEAHAATPACRAARAPRAGAGKTVRGVARSWAAAMAWAGARPTDPPRDRRVTRSATSAGPRPAARAAAAFRMRQRACSSASG